MPERRNLGKSAEISAEVELGALGLKVTFEMKSIDTADAKIWEGVTRRYWWGDKYFLPKCVFRGKV